METVFKYPFEIQDEVILSMPEGAEVILVADQYGVACIWARVNPEAPKVPRHFFVTGTGHPTVKPSYKHVGSFLQGSFVWHVWEKE